MRENIIRAVHSSNITSFLESIDELVAVESGERLCAFCCKPVSTSSIYSIFPQDGDVHYCCQNIRCVSMLIMQSNIE